MVCGSAQSRIPEPPRFFCVGCSVLVRRSVLGAVDLDSLSERELERLCAGLLKLTALPDEELHALVTSLLAHETDT